MKKMTYATLLTLFIVCLIFTAVKTKPVTTVTPAVRECCEATCPGQKADEEKKATSGLIFWDTYSGQLLQIQPFSF